MAHAALHRDPHRGLDGDPPHVQGEYPLSIAMSESERFLAPMLLAFFVGNAGVFIVAVGELPPPLNHDFVIMMMLGVGSVFAAAIGLLIGLLYLAAGTEERLGKRIDDGKFG